MAGRPRRIDWTTVGRFLKGVTHVATLMTAVAALVTALITYGQVQETQFSLSVQTLQNLEREFFEGSSMRSARRKAATGLLGQHETPALDHVLDFFDTVGLLVRLKAIDKDMACHTFYYWIDGYGEASEEILREARREVLSNHRARFAPLLEQQLPER